MLYIDLSALCGLKLPVTTTSSSEKIMGVKQFHRISLLKWYQSERYNQYRISLHGNIFAGINDQSFFIGYLKYSVFVMMSVKRTVANGTGSLLLESISFIWEV